MASDSIEHPIKGYPEATIIEQFGERWIQVKGTWEQEYNSILTSCNVSGVWLRSYDIPNLISQIATNCNINKLTLTGSFCNLNLLEGMTQLCSLTLYLDQKQKLNLQNLTQLTDLYASQSNLTNLSDLPHSIKFLNLNSYLGQDFTPLNSLTKLKSLEIVRANHLTSLTGLNANSLTSLEIYYCKNLTDPSSLHAPKLNHLTLQFSGLHDVSLLKSFDSLEWLDISNNPAIISLKPLTINQLQLETLLFYENTTVLDGDIKSILNLKKLRKIAFKDRRSYNISREMLSQLMEQVQDD